jgi:hypothetical protein
VKFDTYSIFFAIRGDTVRTYRGGYSSLSPAILDTVRNIEVIDIPVYEVKSFSPEVFAKFQDLLDVCPDANLETRYGKDLRWR